MDDHVFRSRPDVETICLCGESRALHGFFTHDQRWIPGRLPTTTRTVDDVAVLLRFIRDRAQIVHTCYHQTEGRVQMNQCSMALCRETQRVLERFSNG